MMNFNRISAIAVTAFAVTLPFSLLACSESNPTNFDEPIAYSEPVLETSSSVTDSSELPATPCTAENEGKVEKVWHEHLPTNGIHSLASWGHYSYHRCEKGSWVEGGISLSFDTVGVQVGDAYIRNYVSNMQSGLIHTDIYTYAGDGNWNLLKCDADRCMEKLTVSPDRKTAYYSYSPLSSQGYPFISGWHETDEADYICFTKKVASNDTCVIESGGEKTFYIFESSWRRIDYDPVLGFCSGTNEYGVKDEKLYYCKYGLWTEKNMIPRQYTDSRKKNLTDDEFDVLDLPKEASVGDRVGGLLEVCFYDQRLDLGHASAAYDMCIPQRYYRYGEDGTWTLDTYYRKSGAGWILQTEEERAKERENARCTSENEGSEYSFLPQVGFVSVVPWEAPAIKVNPGAVYQCVGGKLFFKDFAYGRYDGLKMFYETEANPNLVPRQYTDPRKEGLTDEEYDVLDLPKEASVGDRVGGLLENCLNDQTFSIWEESGTGYTEHLYDYCMPRNYYIYGEDGSWSMETDFDVIVRYSSREIFPDCTPETLGNKVVSEPLPDYPGVVFQCIYVPNNYLEYGYRAVEYIFDRAEKKN